MEYIDGENYKGALMDWDLPQVIVEGPLEPPTMHGSGTTLQVPGIDRLCYGPWASPYRYYLEFLFYALTWGAYHLDLGNKGPLRCLSPAVKGWTSSDLIESYDASTLFLLPGIRKIRLELQTLKGTLIEPRCDLFPDTLSYRGSTLRGQSKYDTCLGLLTLEMFLEAVGTARLKVSSPFPAVNHLPHHPNDSSRLPHFTILSNRHWPLWQSRSVGDLKHAWLDCVKGHETGWRTSCLSQSSHVNETSLAIQYPELKKATGIFIDWDEVAAEDTSARLRRLYQPFLAIDALHGRPWEYLYRYEVESFVYILVWAAVHYDLKTKRRARTVSKALIDWVSGPSRRRGDAKSSLVTSKSGYFREAFYDAVREELEPIVEEVVDPLLDLLAEGYNDRPQRRKGQDFIAEYDYETCGGHITLQKFMERLGACTYPTSLG